MRRADRLYQITLFLRSRSLTTARWLAEALGVSERTIYRDVADLMCTGLDIEGEAGVGYRLRQKNELPPLSFGGTELDALRLGCQLVIQRADRELAQAARQALSRIETALRESGQVMAETALYVPKILNDSVLTILPALREAIRQRQMIHFAYQRADGATSQREVEPMALFYWEDCWTMVGWCRLRNDYRHFRLDRIQNLQNTGNHFENVAGRNLADYLSKQGIRPDKIN